MQVIRRRAARIAIAVSVGALAVGVAAVIYSPAQSTTGAAAKEHSAAKKQVVRKGKAAKAKSWVVTLGDSYLSGEGARWAGNTAGEPGPVDALGEDAYVDAGRGESEPGCHRAEEAQAFIDYGNVRGHNLACSGARTDSVRNGAVFKPGIDFYQDDAGNEGQARMLQKFAATHNVRDVAVTIGGNDFQFGTFLSQCVAKFYSTVNGEHDPCNDDPNIAAIFSDSNVASVTAGIAEAFRNVGKAMKNAGYSARDYSIVVQDYPSPTAPADELRYGETLAERFGLGGCPLFDADADWSNDTSLRLINQSIADAVRDSGLRNVEQIDMSHAFDGHRLCEKGVGQIQETGLKSWRDAGAVDELEWVNMLYAFIKPSPWQAQESVHPNYWGSLAERNCIRQSIRGPKARSGACVARGGLQHGEPRMKLVH